LVDRLSAITPKAAQTPPLAKLLSTTTLQALITPPLDELAGFYVEGDNNTILGAYQGTTADATLNDTVIISAGATERLRIDSSGNVGIGTTNPGAKLDVQGTLFVTNSSALISFNNETEFMGFIGNNSGNLYINAGGTTVNGQAIVSENDGLGEIYFGGSDGTAPIPAAKISAAVDATPGTGDMPGRLAFFTTSDGASSPTERIRIDSDGNVGIGTSDPNSLLQTQGSRDYVGNTPSTSSYDVNFVSNTAGLGIGSSNGIPSIQGFGGGTAYSIALCPNAGRVGIGTTNPEHKLDVSGSGTQTVRALTTDTSGAAIGRLRAEFLGDGGGTNSAVDLRAGDGYSYLVTTTNHPILFGTNGAECARITSSGSLLIATSASRNIDSYPSALQLEGVQNYTNSSISLVHNRTDGGGPNLRFAKSRGTTAGSNTSVASGDSLGQISFYGADGTNADSQAARISCLVDGTPGTGDMPGRLVFFTTADGASSPTERMRISKDGSMFLGTGGIDVNPVSGATAGLSYNNTNKQLVLSRDTGGSLVLRRTGNNGTVQGFYRDTTVVGTISVTTTATAYNTSSDYRLKENVTPVTDGITRLNQLKPSRFNFIADPDTVVDGFLAHEAAEVVPEAVTGEKDAVDDDGNPVHQGIDQSKLVPLLTAALQEALAEIEALKQRLDDAGL
jgi:hypothetical protein